MERYCTKHDLTLGSPRVAQLDLAYHDISRDPWPVQPHGTQGTGEASRRRHRGVRRPSRPAADHPGATSRGVHHRRHRSGAATSPSTGSTSSSTTRHSAPCSARTPSSRSTIGWTPHRVDVRGADSCREYAPSDARVRRGEPRFAASCALPRSPSILALALSGCSRSDSTDDAASEGSSPAPSASAPAIVAPTPGTGTTDGDAFTYEGVTVTGAEGEEPTITLADDFGPAEGAARRRRVRGRGRPRRLASRPS